VGREIRERKPQSQSPNPEKEKNPGKNRRREGIDLRGRRRDQNEGPADCSACSVLAARVAFLPSPKLVREGPLSSCGADHSHPPGNQSSGGG